MEEVPYAVGNVQVPPGGQDPVTSMDQQLQVAEQLMEPGAQAALAAGFDGGDAGADDEVATILGDCRPAVSSVGLRPPVLTLPTSTASSC